MKIRQTKIEIFEDSNPLESRTVVVPTNGVEKVFCHEPYVLEALKMYEHYCSDEIINDIKSYEIGSYKTVKEGVVSSYSEKKGTANIDLSGKHSVHVDVNPKTDNIGVGEKIDVVVTRHRGVINADASSKAAQVEKLRLELRRQIQNPTSAFGAEVKEIVYNSQGIFNGFIVDVNGLRCFMPGMESDVIPLNDYTTMVGKSMYVMPIAESKDSIVVSHKEFLNTLKPGVLDRLSDVKKNESVTGKISSIKHFGVFILIDECVPTLLSVSEMNEETEKKFKENELNVGDDINFYIDNINGDRITITQTIVKSAGWENLKETVSKNEKYVLKGHVKNIFENGVVIVAKEFNDITFFLSVKIIDISVLKQGQEIELPVESVDTVKKTVRLKIDK